MVLFYQTRYHSDTVWFQKPWIRMSFWVYLELSLVTLFFDPCMPEYSGNLSWLIW